MSSKGVESDVWRVKVNRELILLSDNENWASKQWNMIKDITSEMKLLNDPREYIPPVRDWHITIQNYAYDGMSCTQCVKGIVQKDWRNIRIIYMLELDGRLVENWVKLYGDETQKILKVVVCGDAGKVKESEYGKEGWIRKCR